MVAVPVDQTADKVALSGEAVNTISDLPTQSLQAYTAAPEAALTQSSGMLDDGDAYGAEFA